MYDLTWYYTAMDIVGPLCTYDRLPELEVLDLFFQSDVGRKVISGDADIHTGLTRLRALASNLKPLKFPPNGKDYGWAVGIIVSNVEIFSEKYGIDPVDTYLHLRCSPYIHRIVDHSDMWQIVSPEEIFEIIEKELCESFRIDVVSESSVLIA